MNKINKVAIFGMGKSGKSAVELAKEVVSLKEQMVVLMDRLNKLENK